MDISAEDIFDEVFMEIMLDIIREPLKSAHGSFNTTTIPTHTADEYNRPAHIKSTILSDLPIASTSHQQPNNESHTDIDEDNLDSELGYSDIIVEQLATASDETILNAETKWTKLADERNTPQFEFSFAI